MGLYDYDVQNHVAQVSEAARKTYAVTLSTHPATSLPLVEALDTMAKDTRTIIGFVEPLVGKALFEQLAAELASIREWCKNVSGVLEEFLSGATAE